MKAPSTHSRTLALLLLPSFVLVSGCNTMPTTGGAAANTSSSSASRLASTRELTADEKKLRAQSAGFKGQSYVQGCVAGAAAGALVGMLVRGDRSQNVLIGAAAGCGAGLAANAYIQSKRQQFSDNEDRINAMIADVRADNEKLASLIDTTKSVIAADRSRIAEVDAAYRSKSISLQQAKTQLASVRANRDHLQGTVKNLEEKTKNWETISASEREIGTDTSGLDMEISQMESKVNSMKSEVALLDSQINASPIAG